MGGAQHVCIDLCSAAIASGHEVAVASMEGGYLWDQLKPEVKKYQLKNMVKPIMPLKDIRVFFEIRCVIKDFKPDIIHLHSSKAGVLGRLACLFHSSHIVYTVHGFDSIRIQHRIFLPFEKILQHFCGAIIGVSKYDYKNLIAEKISRNVSYIYNGIEEPTKADLDSNIKEAAGQRPIVMTIGRIAYPKNLDLFLQVAKSYGDGALFIWIGGSVEKTMDEVKAEHDIPQNVLLLGDIPNASALIGNCTVFSLFSKYEGLPITIIEALSAGKPVVASNVGGISELVDNSNGFLADENIDSIVNNLKTIIGNADKQKEMGEASRKKYEESFTLSNMWEKYHEQYLKLTIKNK